MIRPQKFEINIRFIEKNALFSKISLNLANICVVIKLSISDSKLLRIQIQWRKLANKLIWLLYRCQTKNRLTIFS